MDLRTQMLKRSPFLAGWIFGILYLTLLCATTLPSVLAQEVAEVKLFKPLGDEVDWGQATNRIAYASRGP